MADYPSAIFSARTSGANLSSNPHSDLHDDSEAEIEAIETELGTNPSGGSATVAARFTALDSTVASISASALRPFGVYQAVNQTIVTATNTTVTLTASYDPNTWLSAGTVIPDTAGWYRCTLSVNCDDSLSARYQARMLVDGSAQNWYPYVDGVGVAGSGVSGNTALSLNGTTNALSVRLFQASGGNLDMDVQLIVELLGAT